jgi:uncharacterized protein YndB with AHSA1/START domain
MQTELPAASCRLRWPTPLGNIAPVPTIEVSVMIRAPLEAVWAAAADLESHVDWMADAESITFITARRRGLGTRMEVATRVGPLRTKDVMEVTEWIDRRRIGVRHTGLVTGEGAFALQEIDPLTTEFTWRERLGFPWYLGGSLTAWLAIPVLRAIWKRNLTRLRRQLES